jgi:hypothetical protein
MSKPIDNKIENILPTAGIFAGYVLIVFGLILSFKASILGVVILIIGAIMSFTYNGVQIDVQNKRIRNYTNCLGIIFGNWEGIEIYTDIAVLQINETSKAYSIGNVALTEKDKYYDVFLLNETHRIKFKIKRCLEKGLAVESAQYIASLLELKYSSYNPIISERTRLRR